MNASGARRHGPAVPSAPVARPRIPRPIRRLRTVLLTGATVLALAAATAPATAPSTGGPPGSHRGTHDPGKPWADRAEGAERRLDRLRDDPVGLRAFLRSMPKGGDLHTHLVGAVPTESLIRYAARDGFCIRTDDQRAVPGPCPEGARPARDAETDPAFRQDVIRAWSMEDFKPTDEESGHDHFFATFAKFDAVAEVRQGRLMADVKRIAAVNRQYYVEPLITPQLPALSRLAADTGWYPDLGRMRAALLAGGRMDRIVRAARAEIRRELARMRRILACGTARPRPGCAVRMRFDYQVLRTLPPEYVFTQLLAGFLLAEAGSRFVGVNLVQPEDDPVALRDYRLHMRMIRYLRGHYPTARVTLHAGELTPAFAPPRDLRFHIRDAVETAGAERIGHGVDILYEDRPWQLMATMSRRRVPVEILLTSNCEILVVCGREHPLHHYLAAGVPIALATDDQGVLRTDITREYQRAAAVQGLGYRELRDSARASLEFAFIQGRSLWRQPGEYSPVPACATSSPRTGRLAPACRALLRSSPRAALQWRQERALAAFESRFAVGPHGAAAAGPRD